MKIVTHGTVGLLTLLIISSVNPGTPAFRQQQVHRLSNDLQRLAPSVNVGEANKMATTAIEKSAKLSIKGS